MTSPKWILTKLGNTGIPVICSSDHPDRESEKYDIIIGSDCFKKNWNANRLVDISERLSLAKGFPILAFKEFLDDQGIKLATE